MQMHVLNLKKKHWYGSEFHSNTGIVYSEVKADKKQLVTENWGKMLFCQNFDGYIPVM